MNILTCPLQTTQRVTLLICHGQTLYLKQSNKKKNVIPYSHLTHFIMWCGGNRNVRPYWLLFSLKGLWIQSRIDSVRFQPLSAYVQ